MGYGYGGYVWQGSGQYVQKIETVNNRRASETRAAVGNDVCFATAIV